MNSINQQFVRDGKLKLFEILVWVGLFIVPVFMPGQSFLINEIAILILFAVSLDLVIGYSGIVTLGQAAFFGTGAYTAGLFSIYVSSDPLTGLVVAIAIAALLGFFFSVTVVRGTALSCLMVTLGVSLILFELANRFPNITGGADGLSGVIIAPVFGLIEFDLFGKVAAYYSLITVLLLFLLVRRYVHSAFTASLVAIRDNRLRALSIGVPIRQRLIVNYTIAAALSGAAGGLLAQTSQFASLDVFDVERSADVLLMLVIGGMGWLYGGVFGTIIFKLLHDLLSSLTPQYWTFWMGLFLVVLMLVGREKLIRPWHWFGRQA